MYDVLDGWVYVYVCVSMYVQYVYACIFYTVCMYVCIYIYVLYVCIL